MQIGCTIIMPPLNQVAVPVLNRYDTHTHTDQEDGRATYP